MANAIVIQDNGTAKKIELKGGPGLIDADAIRQHLNSGSYNPVQRVFSLGGTTYAACFKSYGDTNRVGASFLARVSESGDGGVDGSLIIVRDKEGLLYGLKHEDFAGLEQAIELSGGAVE